MLSKKGFTLVEIMVTLAVASILLIIGAPSLASLYEATRAEQSIKKINTIIAFARNQAMSYNQTVGLCPAGANDCGADWQDGIQVFFMQQQEVADNNGNLVQQINRVMLRDIEAFNDDDLVQLNFTQLQFTADGRIAFMANGAIDNNADTATLTYCPSDNANENSQAIEIYTDGATRVIPSGVRCIVSN